MTDQGAQPYDEDRLWMPPEVEIEAPVDGDSVPEDRNVHINTVPGEVEVATEEELQQEVEKYKSLREPEAAREEEGKPPPPGAAAFGGWYEEKYWTHFDFRDDVARVIARIQKKFPWQTFANTYYMHPPVYARKYERVSVDFWGGGRVNGRYAGYRGKPIGTSLGWNIVNAAMNDPYLPNINWIIFGGKMWTRGVGWGPAPWGPAGSDAGHHFHCHISYVL